MGQHSIRFRISALVTASFAVVVLISSLAFVTWFEHQLVNEVRADDGAELDRQEELLDILRDQAAVDPSIVTVADLTQPVPTPEFPVALIPDDGTVISIRNADGALLGDSDSSLRLISGQADGEPAIDQGAMAQDEIDEGLENMARLLEEVERLLSPEARSEFASSLALLQDLRVAEDEAGSFEPVADALNESIFGRGTRSASQEGRLVTSSRSYELLDQQLMLTAESRVTSIDTALSGVKRTLQFAVPALVALVAALTYAATGRALRPVDDITDQVQTIRSSRSGARVPVPTADDEISHLARTMNAMLDRLESSSASQRRFVSDVSHELRTPTAVIRAEIEAGLADPETDWPKTAESILDEQGRLSDLLDDLLLLARMDETADRVLQDVDLDALIQSEAQRGWRLPVTTVDIEPVRLLGDDRQLSRLIQNLLANANRYAVNQVEVSLRSYGPQARLWVDDDGPGVPAADQDRIFERFARLDESRHRDSGGAGLGLAIVKEVAEAHGGQASVTNSPLGGARFEVCLPRTASIP